MGNWEIEHTDEFEAWWDGLNVDEQVAVAGYVDSLEQAGPTLDHPRSSKIHGSKHGHMRELRVQCQGRPIRVFYAFDPRRCAVLLIGGDKRGVSDDRFYAEFVPKADAIYDAHLEVLELEGLLKKDG